MAFSRSEYKGVTTTASGCAAGMPAEVLSQGRPRDRTCTKTNSLRWGGFTAIGRSGSGASPCCNESCTERGGKRTKTWVVWALWSDASYLFHSILRHAEDQAQEHYFRAKF